MHHFKHIVLSNKPGLCVLMHGMYINQSIKEHIDSLSGFTLQVLTCIMAFLFVSPECIVGYSVWFPLVMSISQNKLKVCPLNDLHHDPIQVRKFSNKRTIELKRI